MRRNDRMKAQSTEKKRADVDSRPRRSRRRNNQTDEDSYEGDYEPYYDEDIEKRDLTAYIILTIIAGIAVALLLGWDLFIVRNVEINGIVNQDYNELIAYSGIMKNENIFKVDLQAVKERLEMNPYVEVEKIARVYPNTLSINIRERQVRAVFFYISSYVLIDEDGHVLEISASMPTGDYPFIKGLNLSSCTVGSAAQTQDANQMKSLDDLITALYETDTVQWIGEIDMTYPYHITMITKEGITIESDNAQGVEDLSKRLIWLNEIVPTIRTEGYTKGTIYLTDAEKASFIPAE